MGFQEFQGVCRRSGHPVVREMQRLQKYEIALQAGMHTVPLSCLPLHFSIFNKMIKWSLNPLSSLKEATLKRMSTYS